MITTSLIKKNKTNKNKNKEKKGHKVNIVAHNTPRINLKRGSKKRNKRKQPKKVSKTL